jgi:hypothetical protein
MGAMSTFDRNPALRWSVPVVAAAVFVGGGAALDLVRASARDGLPARSAAQLLTDVQNARVDGLSGTIAQNVNLGIPDLPGIGGGGSSDLTSLVTGSHTLRVWYDGTEHVRVALLGSLGESDVIRSGPDLWTWSSDNKSATHWTLPSGAHADAPSEASPTELPMTPQQAADKALKAIDPSTKVSTDGTAVVAGRSAYELVLQPRDARTLVDSVRIAIDGRTHIPTRVEVFAKGVSKPAFEVGFTTFDPTRPDAAVFRFNPPQGTAVTEQTGNPLRLPERPELAKKGGGSHEGRRVVGSGWTSVVVLPGPTAITSKSSASKESENSPMLTRLLDRLPRVSGTWGSGRLLKGTLFSVLVTDDGRVVAGAVSPDLLYHALAAK